MKPMDRRRFLLTTAATAVSLKALAQTPATTTATLTLHSDKPGLTVPANFVGLSYEVQQLSDPNFFSSKNTGLIAMFRTLAPHGVLRLGGNTSDVGWWKATPTSKQPPYPPSVTLIPLPPGERTPQELSFAITPEAIVNLRAFLDATGWTCLYGINLASSTPERAVEEAAFVAKTLGDKLEYFQLGNEPDLFPHRFREKSKWTADAYLDEWLAAANAIRARVPNARFGLPDTGGSQWATLVSDRLAAMHDHPNIAAISHHYYFTGPPSNPKANIADLLKPDISVIHTAQTTRAAAAKLGTKYRMTEGNTCYQGGRPGFSDVFASSLWAADYLLTLASFGYAGVNLHGGGGKAVADSLGGKLAGEALMTDPNAPHPRPFYTPIADIDGKCVAEPVFYGLLFAQQFAGATFLPVNFDPVAINATAYAAKLPNGKIVLAIINKDEHAEVRITLKGRKGTASEHLTAPSLASTSGEVKFDKTRSTAHSEITVPAASATIFDLT